MSASKYVFNAGEVRNFYRIQKDGGEACSCGENTLLCDFWGEMYRAKHNLFQKTQLSQKIIIILKIIFGRTVVLKQKIPTYSDLEFYLGIRKEANKRNNQGQLIVDNSKTIWRLHYLLQHSEVDIKPIFLKREIFGNVSSSIKNGDSFTKGLFLYKANAYLMTRYLKLVGVNFHQISYEDLCVDTDVEMERLGRFLNIDYSRYSEGFPLGNIHLPSGNIGFRSRLEGQFRRLTYDDSWIKRLTINQKRIVKLLNWI